MLPSSFLFFLATTASAAVLESLNAVPAGWKYTGAASNDEPIRLQIALQQGDAEAFEQAVIDMSTPGKIHPRCFSMFVYHVVLHAWHVPLVPEPQSHVAELEFLQNALSRRIYTQALKKNKRLSTRSIPSTQNKPKIIINGTNADLTQTTPRMASTSKTTKR